ncbi:MAG: DUF1570 domain-containing protein [Planctomycetia bacterium]|nr:DUF1570 domain-containing protein [Planctomycetia bacterium]
MKRILTAIALASVFAVLLPAGAARADLIEIYLDEFGIDMQLWGTVKINPGRSATFTHALGILYFNSKNIKKQHKVKPPRDVFTKDLDKAKQSKNADEMYNAALYALQRGMLKEFWLAVDEALKVDPNHKCKELKQFKADVIDKPVTADQAAQESYIKKIVRNPNMRVDVSNHFLLLHDTPAKVNSDNEWQKKPRGQARLELLELVYQTFLLKFKSMGVQMEIPQERLLVVLFNDYKNYLSFATSLDPSLQSASGFYVPSVNVSFFFDHGTRSDGIKKLRSKLPEMKRDAAKAKDGEFVRFLRALDFLLAVDQENSDITVVSHECTHQMASNTGLLPRHVLIPAWVHEGLATYFEAPGDATWAGIGAANEERLTFYRALENDREHSNIDFIVGDKIFDHAAGIGAVLHGYAQAWALTHFLVERHPTELVKFYQRLGEFPPDTALSPEILTEVFNECFGDRRAELDSEWRIYMSNIKTDTERILGE